MFAVLDTNHFAETARNSERGRTLLRRVEAAEAQIFTTVITVQEVAAGWLTLINRQRTGRKQVSPYTQFQHSMELLSGLIILPFDYDAADRFESLQRLRLRTGTLDLKIAAICIVHDATLLTRNLVDFARVPGLRAENWLD